MRRMTFGKPDAEKPPVRFDEGRGWDRKLTTTDCLTPLIRWEMSVEFRWLRICGLADARRSGGLATGGRNGVSLVRKWTPQS